jgi:hypothetical protein
MTALMLRTGLVARMPGPERHPGMDTSFRDHEAESLWEIVEAGCAQSTDASRRSCVDALQPRARGISPRSALAPPITSNRAEPVGI